MSQSLSQQYTHIIFSTKNRCPFLTDDFVREKLYDYIKTICFKQHCQAINIGGIEDHIHVLVNLNKNVALSLLVEKIKKYSSKWIKTVSSPIGKLKDFYWQSGYAAFSVSQSNLEIVKLYITNQVVHHQKYTYQDELRKILNRYQVKYDEKYIWD